MRNILCLTICTLVFLSCKSETVGTSGSQSISGRTTIDSTSGYGFSFARGTPQQIPPFPIQDSVDDFNAGFVETGSDPTPIGLCFEGYTSHMFHLVRSLGTPDSARTLFQTLSEISDTMFIQGTCGITKANQIWSVQTRQNKFAKMLIVTDTSMANHLQITFDWVYQPSGSRRF